MTLTPDETIFRIPWGHHIVILGKCANNKEKALFYVHKTLENQWSRAMLLNMMGDKDGRWYSARVESIKDGPKSFDSVESGDYGFGLSCKVPNNVPLFISKKPIRIQ